jgi:hypothetical protein
MELLDGYGPISTPSDCTKYEHSAPNFTESCGPVNNTLRLIREVSGGQIWVHKASYPDA